MSAPVKVPAEVERPDQLLGPLTARQLVILAATALGLYLAWAATRTLLPLPGFLAFAVPVAGTLAALALARRDGLGLDQFAVAALRHYATTRDSLPRLRDPGTGPTRVPAWITRHATTRRAHAARTPATRAPLPARRVHGLGTGIGLIDLDTDGQVIVAVASTVNFALRSPAEQEALIATFARYLHSLAAEVHILIRAVPIDLTPAIRRLRHTAPNLPHPALRAAAADHAAFLSALAEQRDLLGRQVLVIFREPAPATTRHPRGHITGRAGRAHTQLTHRLAEATTLLAPAGITLTPLDAEQASAILAAATHPARLTPAHALAPPHTPIQRRNTHQPDHDRHHHPGGGSSWPDNPDDPHGDDTGLDSRDDHRDNRWDNGWDDAPSNGTDAHHDHTHPGQHENRGDDGGGGHGHDDRSDRDPDAGRRASRAGRGARLNRHPGMNGWDEGLDLETWPDDPDHHLDPDDPDGELADELASRAVDTQPVEYHDGPADDPADDLADDLADGLDEDAVQSRRVMFEAVPRSRERQAGRPGGHTRAEPPPRVASAARRPHRQVGRGDGWPGASLSRGLS